MRWFYALQWLVALSASIFIVVSLGIFAHLVSQGKTNAWLSLIPAIITLLVKQSFMLKILQNYQRTSKYHKRSDRKRRKWLTLLFNTNQYVIMRYFESIPISYKNYDNKDFIVKSVKMITSNLITNEGNNTLINRSQNIEFYTYDEAINKNERISFLKSADLVIIDESHTFRNDNPTYRKLKKISPDLCLIISLASMKSNL